MVTAGGTHKRDTCTVTRSLFAACNCLNGSSTNRRHTVAHRTHRCIRTSPVYSRPQPCPPAAHCLSPLPLPGPAYPLLWPVPTDSVRQARQPTNRQSLAHPASSGCSLLLVTLLTAAVPCALLLLNRRHSLLAAAVPRFTCFLRCAEVPVSARQGPLLVPSHMAPDGHCIVVAHNVPTQKHIHRRSRWHKSAFVYASVLQVTAAGVAGY